MITKKQLANLPPKPFIVVGRWKWVSKVKVTEDEEDQFEKKFFPKKTYAPELGKYVDMKKRGYYTTSELKTIL